MNIVVYNILFQEHVVGLRYVIVVNACQYISDKNLGLETFVVLQV